MPSRIAIPREGGVLPRHCGRRAVKILDTWRVTTNATLTQSKQQLPLARPDFLLYVYYCSN